jgi:hypothetical protein
MYFMFLFAHFIVNPDSLAVLNNFVLNSMPVYPQGGKVTYKISNDENPNSLRWKF